MDTAYITERIRRIGNWTNAFSCEVQALIRRISLVGYGVLCMTRSLTKELLTPFKNPEREFCLSRKLFKTSSFDKSSSPEFDLFFDLEEHSEEEVAEIMMETVSAASRWLRNKPSGSITTWEGLKTKFLNKYCPPARTAKKMKEINNFQQELNETLYQAWERFKELLIKCPQHYLTDMQKVILFYSRLEVLTRQILDSKGAIPTKTTADAKVAIQEMAEYFKKWHNGTSRTRSTKTSNGLAAI
ncbi:retrovirus-related pol polyprotein from transposon TNT 1-94 [Tanacetum coccineum]